MTALHTTITPASTAYMVQAVAESRDGIARRLLASGIPTSELAAPLQAIAICQAAATSHPHGLAARVCASGRIARIVSFERAMFNAAVAHLATGARAA